MAEIVAFKGFLSPILKSTCIRLMSAFSAIIATLGRTRYPSLVILQGLDIPVQFAHSFLPRVALITLLYVFIRTKTNYKLVVPSSVHHLIDVTRNAIDHVLDD